MIALAATPTYDFGDQFLYPTQGSYPDEGDSRLIGLFESPTRPLVNLRLKEFTKSEFTVGQLLRQIDGLFPAATTLMQEIFDVSIMLQVGDDAQEASTIEREIVDYQTFPNNWDGHGGLPPEADVVSCAVHIVRNFPSDLPLPEPSLTHDGTVALDILDANFRSKCTIEVLPGRRAIYSLSAHEEVKVGSFALNGDSEMIATLGMLSQQLS